MAGASKIGKDAGHEQAISAGTACRGHVRPVQRARYEQTTVEDITERAGLGHTTFFRYYRSKDDVIFPDHDRLLEQIGERLRTSSHGTAVAAVSERSA